MGKFHPSRRSYATSISNTQTNLEQLGGNSKAGLGFNIGLQNSLNQHIKQRAPTLSGSNMIIPKQKGLVNSVYEINTSNQLNNVKTVKYGMTRSPADGVNKIEREFDQKYTDYWLAAQHLNRNIPIIRGILPTNCCLPLSFSEKQLEDVLNKKIVDNFNFNLGNDLGNDLGNESQDSSFLYYFQLAVGRTLDNTNSYWQTTNPKSSKSFLISDDVGLEATTHGIFVRYILDDEQQDFVPASFVSNRSPVPQKIYILTAGPGSPRPSDNNSDPVVLLMKIGNVAGASELLPNTNDVDAYFMAGYPHDANSMDPNKGRQWWPNSGKFGQGLHESFPTGTRGLEFNISMTPGAWEKNSILIDGNWVQPVLSTSDSPPIYSDTIDWQSKALMGGGGLNEHLIDSNLFKDGTNDGAEDLTYLDVYNLYKKFIEKTYIGKNDPGILTTAKKKATDAGGDGTAYNELLDGMLPSVLAIIGDGSGANLDIRLMLSKLLTFNTLLWNNFPSIYDDKFHWGWNEIPVRKDNTLWKSNNTAKNIYNLLVYIPNWNSILTTDDYPWKINGSQQNFWANLSNQLEKYVDKLNTDDDNIDYINFVFATDEAVNAPNNLNDEVLKNRTAYQITGFTSLGKPSKPPSNNFTFTTPNYTFTYYKDNITTDSGEILIVGDSFVWKK